ncbi:MAG TPA: peptidylprolyl isomerase [Candidatus Omnitrophota bacterium]|nr:peptidylprolyl isomerase [Candidatus Omnitrophota bacterium]HPD85479.1 peptidylprolyl isomerase [Candidatus Omnitrophota bacterium]HRZ04020.1 peptidylprolyl isomerase [Candidatus Omnitrophota bacterium]
MKRFLSLALCGVLFFMFAGISISRAESAKITDGSKVSFDYTLTVDGKVIDSSSGRGPIQYTQGKSEIVPGLEKELAGMKVGDEKTVIVKPEEGYGLVSPEALKEVSRANLPADIQPQVGMVLQIHGADGRAFPAMIAKVDTDTVVLNFNHPLAGKELNFQVKIVSIN